MQRRKKILFALGAFGVAVLLFCVAGELLFRFVLADELEIRLEERNLAYDFDSRLGWFPKPGYESTFTASTTIDVRHNSLGFRDDEWGAKTRPRLVVVGDSFTWGYDVQEEDRFTEALAAMLPDWEVLNLGVSGYGWDQEYLILQQYFDELAPDIVLLIACTNNDRDDNSRNSTHGGFYKPYFVVEDDELQLRGTPVEKSINYYYVSQPSLFRSYLYRALAKTWFKLVRSPFEQHPDPSLAILEAMQRFVVSRGARFAIGFQEEVPELARVAEDRDIPYVNLDTTLVFPGHGWHWTPDGHRFVAERIHGMLSAAGWI